MVSDFVTSQHSCHSIGGTRHRVPRPIRLCSLKLQSHSKASVGQPLTVDHSSKGPQIARDGFNSHAFVPLHGLPRQDPHTE